ncbi:hypothetical protein GSI_14393 [Ganoderma sinense ZZ0214-1]|uniref:Uncharacterized protein n=1 Tax=Ganoderma sinense ZZ0214-1 TaxID=1077348 RepID=A0A2G8RNI7_9APHY|nr:hypothetical protein GSI_14393 [Ganoderma sinense ZZ0214-1]
MRNISLIHTTALEFRQVNDINDLALNDTLYYAADLSYVALDIGLSSFLFGVLTLLVILAVIFLIRKGLSHTPVRILLPSTLLLYGSTALYMAALASHGASVDNLTARARAGLFSHAYTDADVVPFQTGVLKQSWMMTIALIINILIGDSIVWWRVCVVWRHWVVYYTGPLLIVVTCALGLKDLLDVHHCVHSCRQPQMLLPAGVFAITCASLSFGINILATGLIGYKAWTHWRFLRQHLGYSFSSSWVFKALALLVESGTIYCFFLIIVVVYEASPSLFAGPDVHQSAFLRIVADYTYACYIHVMAIYPVVIIVIVALNSSPIDHGLTNAVHLGNGDDPSSLDSTLDFTRTTVSIGTVVGTATMPTPRAPGGEEGPSAKQDSLGV